MLHKFSRVQSQMACTVSIIERRFLRQGFKKGNSFMRKSRKKVVDGYNGLLTKQRSENSSVIFCLNS